MKNLILLFSLFFLFTNCQSQKLANNCDINTIISHVEEGKIVFEITNNRNKPMKIPEEIDNRALIITEFQRIIKEGFQYENIERPIIHFDCLSPCFPLTYTLKKGDKKVYHFNIFNPNILSKKNKYRIKLSMENYFGEKCREVQTDWIYFEVK